MERNELMTVEYCRADQPDALIGAVYVPKGSALAACNAIGKAILKATGGNALRACLLDRDGRQTDEVTVFRAAGK